MTQPNVQDAAPRPPLTSVWNAGAFKTRALIGCVVAICGVFALGAAIRYFTDAETLYPDFYGFWCFGRFSLSHPAAGLYDNAAVLAYEVAGGMPAERFYPFLYPPPILLALLPFGAMPYGAARIAWIALGFGAYVAALAPWRWRRPLPMALLVAPSTVACVLLGQNGFFSAALMLGGLRLLPRHAMLGGALLGLLAYKPSLCVLLPVMLLAQRDRRSILGAAIVFAVLCAASVVVFGPDVWTAWAASMGRQAYTLASGRADLNDKMPTVTASVLLWGGSAGLANAAQLVAAGLAGWAVWRTARRGDATGRAVLPVATVLATPYVFDYDMPLVTGAVLGVLADWMRRRLTIPFADLMILLASVVLPVILLAHAGRAASAMLMVLAALLWRLSLSPRSRTPAPAL